MMKSSVKIWILSPPSKRESKQERGMWRSVSRSYNRSWRRSKIRSKKKRLRGKRKKPKRRKVKRSDSKRRSTKDSTMGWSVESTSLKMKSVPLKPCKSWYRFNSQATSSYSWMKVVERPSTMTNTYYRDILEVRFHLRRSTDFRMSCLSWRRNCKSWRRRKCQRRMCCSHRVQLSSLSRLMSWEISWRRL